MSRVANSPVEVPAGVDFKLNGQELSVKGSNGTLAMTVHSSVEVKAENNVVTFAARGGDKMREQCRERHEHLLTIWY